MPPVAPTANSTDAQTHYFLSFCRGLHLIIGCVILDWSIVFMALDIADLAVLLID
jgi:hypothetical protein